MEYYKKYKNYQNVMKLYTFHKYIILSEFVTKLNMSFYIKRGMCVCFPSSVFLSSSEEGYRGVFLLCDPLLPSPLYASGLSCAGCVSCSDSRFSDTRFLGDWNSAPSSIHLLPLSFLGEGPQPGQAPAQPPPCGVSESYLGSRLPGCTDWLWQSCWEGCQAPFAGFFCGPSLVSLPLWGHLPFCPCCPFCILITGGSVAQPSPHATSWETQLPFPGP